MIFTTQFNIKKTMDGKVRNGTGNGKMYVRSVRSGEETEGKARSNTMPKAILELEMPERSAECMFEEVEKQELFL